MSSHKTKKANREYSAKYRKNNSKEVKAALATWYKKNRKQHLIYMKEYFKKNYSTIRASRYGLSKSEYLALLKKQRNKCAICNQTFVKTPQIDHDHKCCSIKRSCGRCIRGLLCDGCNTGLGRLKDSIKLLKAAIKYIEGFASAHA